MLSTETKQFCFIIWKQCKFCFEKNFFALSSSVAIALNTFSQSDEEKLVLLEDGAVVSTIVVRVSKWKVGDLIWGIKVSLMNGALSRG